MARSRRTATRKEVAVARQPDPNDSSKAPSAPEDDDDDDAANNPPDQQDGDYVPNRTCAGYLYCQQSCEAIPSPGNLFLLGK